MRRRRLERAEDELARIVGDAPPVASVALAGDTRLTGLWRNEPYDVQLQPMQDHVIAATFDGSGHARATIDGRRYTAATVPGTFTLAPRGHDGAWRITHTIVVNNVYLGHDRVLACADTLAPGRGFDLLDRVNANDPRLFALMHLICAEVEAPRAHSTLYLERAVDLLCIELLRSHSTLGRVAAPTSHGLAGWQVRRVTGYMQDHLAAPVALQDLADLIGMSRFHFCTAFRRAVGLPPHAYMTRLRMARARELLADTALRIVDVALAVGYENTSAFSSAFRRAFGCSPRDFRKRL